MKAGEKRYLLRSLQIPAGYIIILWLIKLSEVLFSIDFSPLGVYPQKLSGLTGIFTGPLVHGDFKHLLSNTFPLLILGGGVFYFYRVVSVRIFILSYLLSGISVWIFGRPSYHIGSSGLIYAFAAFLFVSGIIRRVHSLATISLLVSFLYGGIIWGILPAEERISWEGHLSGLVWGIVLAFIYKNKGPKKNKRHDYEDEEDQNPYGNDFLHFNTTNESFDIKYNSIPEKK
jgi:membrane associated rhomboid family serine protease